MKVLRPHLYLKYGVQNLNQDCRNGNRQSSRAVLELLTQFHVECWLQQIVHKIWTIPWCPARKIFYNNKVFLKFKLRIHNVQHWCRTYISAWYPQRHCVTCLVSPEHQVRSSSPSKLWQLASQRTWNGMERGDQNAELFSPIFLAWRDSLNLSPDFLRCLWFLVVCGGKLKWSEREEKGLTMRHTVDNTKPWPLFLIRCKSQNCCLLACTPLLIFVLNLCG